MPIAQRVHNVLRDRFIHIHRDVPIREARLVHGMRLKFVEASAHFSTRIGWVPPLGTRSRSFVMRITNRTRIAVLALGLMFAVGCSGLPTQPVPDQQTTASEPLRTRQIDAIPEDVTPPPPTTLVSGVTTTVRINGLLGGTVSAGKFTVIFPPAAFMGQATVTVSQPDANLVCNLDITPASKNRFLLPVLLVADASSLPREVLSISTIQWWDPAKAKWVNVPGVSVNLLNLTVQAPLWHFSSYRVQGRAGW
jgi:hypothetical protein